MSVIYYFSLRQCFLEVKHIVEQRPDFLQVVPELAGIGFPISEADAEGIKKRPQHELIPFAEYHADGTFRGCLTKRCHGCFGKELL